MAWRMHFRLFGGRIAWAKKGSSHVPLAVWSGLMAEADIQNAPKPSEEERKAHFSLLASLGRAAVRGLDRGLRRLEGVEEFCRRKDCIFRIALVRRREEVRLIDGTHVRRGDPVGEIHYWNEHVPRLGEGRSALAWALAADRAVRRSLQALAAFAESDSRYQNVQVFGGVMCGLPIHGVAESGRHRAPLRLRDAAHRTSARPGALPAPLGRRYAGPHVGVDVQPRQPAPMPARCEIRISRKVLLSRYGSGVSPQSHREHREDKKQDS